MKFKSGKAEVTAFHEITCGDNELYNEIRYFTLTAVVDNILIDVTSDNLFEIAAAILDIETKLYPKQKKAFETLTEYEYFMKDFTLTDLTLGRAVRKRLTENPDKPYEIMKQESDCWNLTIKQIHDCIALADTWDKYAELYHNTYHSFIYPQLVLK